MKQILLTLLLSFLVLSCFGQKKLDKIVNKADAYYKSMKYHKAIPLYQEAISIKGKHTLALRTKLAYSYRMLNQMDDAELLYADIVTDKKARIITFYYYGEALMANGKYDEAKAWFLKYDEQNPKDTRAITMASACEKAKDLRPIFPDITLSRMTFNTAGDDYAPMFYDDGLLFVSDNVEVEKKQMEYEWTGRSFSSIYYAKADSAEIYRDEPLPFSKKFNKRDKNSGPSSISGNGKFFYFSRNNDIPNKNGNKYTMAIYVAERTIAGWKTPQVLPICNENFSFMHPAASFTGDTLYFITDKPGGFGETDIYMTYRKEIKKRNKKGELEVVEKWMLPTNLGAGVNTAEREAFPYVSNDGKLYFSSKGHPGFGGFDLFEAHMNDDNLFEYAVNLGSNINSPKDDMSIIFAPDKRTGYFASNRLSGTDDDIFAFRKGHKQIMISGEVMNLVTKQYLAGAKIILKSFDNDFTEFSDKQGNFKFKVKPGKKYTLKITKRGFVPYEYPIDATKMKDGEVLPFLIKLRQLEDIPYAHINHEQSQEEEEPDLSIYEPSNEVLNEEIDPYEYLPPSIPARGLVAKHVKKVVDETQTDYRKRKKSATKISVTTAKKSINNTANPEAMPETVPEAMPEMMPEVAPETAEKEKIVKNKKSTIQPQKPSSMTPKRTEAKMDNTNEEIPQKQMLPESETHMMFMDLDVINEYNKPINQVVLYLMNEKGNLLETIYTNTDGEVELTLQPRHTYLLKLERNGFISKTIMICTDRQISKDRLDKKVLMKSVRDRNSYDFKNLSFEKGIFELDERSKIELDRVAYVMTENPDLTIELTGYTDALGDVVYNKKLSKQRAMQAANYLIAKDIKPTRIVLKSKGADELVNGCKEGIRCSEKLHQENRRVTIEVIN
ncbi:MAG: OmpA family protein [Saprospiraceae bacterium]